MTSREGEERAERTQQRERLRQMREHLRDLDDHLCREEEENRRWHERWDDCSGDG
jgi:hypothetical protein